GGRDRRPVGCARPPHLRDLARARPAAPPAVRPPRLPGAHEPLPRRRAGRAVDGALRPGAGARLVLPGRERGAPPPRPRAARGPRGGGGARWADRSSRGPQGGGDHAGPPVRRADRADGGRSFARVAPSLVGRVPDPEAVRPLRDPLRRAHPRARGRRSRRRGGRAQGGGGRPARTDLAGGRGGARLMYALYSALLARGCPPSRAAGSTRCRWGSRPPPRHWWRPSAGAGPSSASWSARSPP